MVIYVPILVSIAVIIEDEKTGANKASPQNPNQNRVKIFD